MEKERSGFYRETRRSDLLAVIFGVICIALIIGVSRYFLMQVRYGEDQPVVADIEKLQTIFNSINESAQIVSFKGRKAPINFLTVRSFAGSSVGPLKVTRPDQWKGPYITEPIEAQGIEYQLVATKKGVYIVPGDGVQLANGKVMGDTVRITDASDIDVMMSDPTQLQSKSKPLAAKLTLTPQRAETPPKEFTRVVDFDEEDDLTTY